MVVEALAALWFWTQFSSMVVLPAVPDPVLPAVRASGMIWDTPAEAWRNPVSAAFWARHWQEATGCCVDFVFSPETGACSGRVRLVQAKSLPVEGGWRMGFVVTACG